MARTTRRRSAGPTLFALVRHGTTSTTGQVLPGRAPGLELSESGQREAKAAATRVAALAGEQKPKRGTKKLPPVVYASPLERAQQTAGPIAEALSCEVRTDDGLLELDIGEWTGTELKVASKRSEWKQIQQHPSTFRFPGGESFLEMQARMVGTIERLRKEHPDQLVVCVSHADPIRSLMAHAVGAHLDMMQRIFISPASLSTIAVSDDGTAVLGVNVLEGGWAGDEVDST